MRTREPHWLPVFERSGDCHLGQTLVRLARLAESLHRSMAAEHRPAPAPRAGEMDPREVGSGDDAAPDEGRRLVDQGTPR